MVSFNNDVFLIFHPPFFYHFNTDIFTYIRTSGSGLLQQLVGTGSVAPPAPSDSLSIKGVDCNFSGMFVSRRNLDS